MPDGGFFDFGDKIPYRVTVTDPEDATIDCSKVTVQTQLGHDSHAHPLDIYTGCSSVLATEADAGDGHRPGQNLYTVSIRCCAAIAAPPWSRWCWTGPPAADSASTACTSTC